ncbi:MAG: ABC transporter permease [Agathobacter sp.]|uniref:ABC transporter permease n=1 Tax=Agathobacter sp. TaxID=2021311 RepID=UPI0025888C30|nr:ABC transporter permease [Agathobacter sp.]MCR5678317.1 ABC transporter permease [Agathobacter sp.]
MNKRTGRLLAGPYLFWMIGFVILPLLFVFVYAFTNSDGNISLEAFRTIFTSTNAKAIGLSLELGLLTTVICLLLAYPLAMILNGIKIKSQSFIVFIFMLPMWMNFMLRILAWKQLLNKNGVLNAFLSLLGLPGIDILNTPAAVVFGMVYDFLPFMLLPIYNAMSRIRQDWIEAARDLGAGNLIILVRIIFPLTLSGVISGIVMVFVPSLTSFAISQILGGGKVLLIGNVIEQDFMQGNQWNAGSALSMILMIFVLLSMAIMNLFQHDEEGTQLW